MALDQFVVLLLMIGLFSVTSEDVPSLEETTAVPLTSILTTTLSTTSVNISTVPSSTSTGTSTNIVPKTSTEDVPKTSTEAVPKTSTEAVPKTTPCKVLVGIDEPLYNKYYDKDMPAIVDNVNKHFDQINQIYNEKIFTGDLGGVYFKVARIQVMFGSCDAIKYENCTHQREKFLEIFDQYDFKEFCLAYMFTFRDFHNGTAGLASTPGLCRREKNSGFITFLNYNLTRNINETVITLAHELGHSLGALHDNKVKEVDGGTEECNSTTSEECGCGSGFIMEGFSNGTTRPEFSNCSVDRIKQNIKQVMESSANCLKQEEEPLALETALCGNLIVDPGEECDCGNDQISCNDPCCYPAHISPWERSSNQSALPCSRTSRTRCLSPPSLIYGVYLPMAFILAFIILTGVLLRHDWKREKNFFTHITRGNVRIVSRRQNRRIVGGESIPQPLYA